MDSNSWKSHRARVASLSRSRQPDDPDLIAARRDLKALRLELDVTRAIVTEPPLTRPQRDRLALLLSGGAS